METVSTARFRFGIAGVALEVDGPEAWLVPLQAAWSAWRPADGIAVWPVAVTANADLERPKGPLFEVMPRCLRGRCTLVSASFRGEVDAEQQAARLEAHPLATPADVGYFLRVTLAVQAFVRGGVLFHAAGVLHHGKGYAFFGLSGSGKTTAAQFSAPDPVLNDDLLLLWPETDGWQVYATPFGKRRGDVHAAPLHALLRLVKDDAVFLESLPAGRVMAELVSNTPVLSGDAALLTDVFARWEAVMTTLPVCALHFRRDPTFWEVIDAELG